MKKHIAAILGILLLLACPAALADVDLAHNPGLTEQALLAPILQTEYAGWQLYQPTSSEIVGEDMTKDTGFPHRRFFPVVAVRDNRAVVILLQKVDAHWTVYGTNETALHRQGLTLRQFSIDSNDAYNQAVGSGLPIYFIFEDAEGAHYQLSLTATDIYTTRFDFINFSGRAGDAPKLAEYLFADSFILGFNSGYSFSYYFRDPYMELRYSMNVMTGESDYDNFATFDLSRVPWSIFEVMETCTAYSDAGTNGGKILLKQFNADGAATLCEIPEGTQLLREVDSFGFAHRDYVLVAYGELLGYLPKANLGQL